MNFLKTIDSNTLSLNLQLLFEIPKLIIFTIMKSHILHYIYRLNNHPIFKNICKNALQLAYKSNIRREIHFQRYE